MRVLELGNYVAPAYAGMLLAEQGHQVEKWHIGSDPILGLHQGAALWAWINYGKTLAHRNLRDVPAWLADNHVDIVLDNFRPAALNHHGVDPAVLASEFGLTWVSLRSEVGERSFDVVAQARSWMEYGQHVPFWLGDTSAGLWMAFKALAAQHGHYVLGQATCLQKMVEGELIVGVAREQPHPRQRPIQNPFDPDPYYADERGAVVEYRGARIEEPIRDREWKMANLWHRDGRMTI